MKPMGAATFVLEIIWALPAMTDAVEVGGTVVHVRDCSTFCEVYPDKESGCIVVLLRKEDKKYATVLIRATAKEKSMWNIDISEQRLNRIASLLMPGQEVSFEMVFPLVGASGQYVFKKSSTVTVKSKQVPTQTWTVDPIWK